jgi:hypothetical protein
VTREEERRYLSEPDAMVLSTDGSSEYCYCTCVPKQVRIEKYNQLDSCKECQLGLPDQESIYTAFKNVEQIQYVGTKGLKEKWYLIATIIEQQRFRRGVDKLIRKYGTESLSSTLYHPCLHTIRPFNQGSTMISK